MEYVADFLDTVLVREVAAKNVVSLMMGFWTVDRVRAWMTIADDEGSRHQGYPVVDSAGHLVGVLTRRNILDAMVSGEKLMGELVHRPPVIVYPDATLRDAADHMANHDIGRLPVIDRQTRKVVGMVTRSDLLAAHRRRLKESGEAGEVAMWRG